VREVKLTEEQMSCEAVSLRGAVEMRWSAEIEDEE
jgi:hypothetical protein